MERTGPSQVYASAESSTNVVVGQQREVEEVVVDQDAVPGQSQVGEVEPRVEEVQETMDMIQQPLVVSLPEDMTAGNSSRLCCLWHRQVPKRCAALPGQV